MKQSNGQYIFSPTDLCVFMESRFASWMDRYRLDHPGEVTPDETTEDQRVVMKKGVEHEKGFVGQLITSGHSLVEIPGTGDRFASTLSSIREGADSNYQGGLSVLPFEGFSDFLAKIEGNSDFGDHHYEVWDTKLGRKPKPYYIIQLCCYADMLERLQGRRPASRSQRLERVLGHRTLCGVSHQRSTERKGGERKMKRLLIYSLIPALLALGVGCTNISKRNNGGAVLRYVGSSTIANFIHDAEPVYGRVRFVVDTEPESVGGELAIREGRGDLAGFAGTPDQTTLEMGVVATLIGKDAIAVVVNSKNPVSDLAQEELKGIFTGRITNWKEVGGPDLAIQPFIVGEESATRKVFRSIVLGESDYEGCEVVRPDKQVPMKVEAEPGGVGQISFSFLGSCGHVKTVSVDGQQAVPTNSDYPITRPLYLLWWEGRQRVKDFISWTSTSEAEAILIKRFARAKASGQSRPGG